MKKLADMFRESMMELKRVQVLTIVSMLTALTAVLGFFTIVIGDFIKIGFAFLAKGIAGMLYGPAASGILGGISDILNYMIKPTGAFFPGFTFNSILGGVIYGVCLYKKPITMKRIFLTNLLIAVIVELGLSTLWLSILYGKGFFILLPMRMVKALIILPLQSAMLYFLATKVKIIFSADKHKARTKSA